VAIHTFLRPKFRPAFARPLSLAGRGTGSPTAGYIADVGRLAAQAILLSLIYLASSAILDVVRVPVPSNLLALVVLLVLLMIGVVPLNYVDQLATFLLRHLTFFFVPFMVGLIAQGDLLASSGAALLVSLVVAAAVGIIVAGLAAQAVSRWSGGPHVDV
jgi:holin-like protein